MAFVLRRCLLLLICTSPLFAAERDAPRDRPPPKLELRIDREGWGKASLPDVEAVLRSAGSEMSRHFPGVRLQPLIISPRSGPITLFQRAPDGAIRIKLNTTDLFWSQCAYQFAHELCHVLCRYEEKDTGSRWFEESVCELASLFVLRQMSESWKTRPPYSNWKGYAPHLAKYAQERIDKSPLPAGKTLAAWYAENADALRKDAVDRERNNVVAAALLPLFEAEPAHWAAVYYLNVDKPNSPQPFPTYLQNWHNHAPPEHQPFVRRIGQELGITLGP